MTAATATTPGIDVRTVAYRRSAPAGAGFVGRDTPGATQLGVDASREVIVGATLLEAREKA